MARKAEFVLNGQSYFAEMKKVDRKKIYGWSTVEVFDDKGSKCKLAALAEGKHVMPSGSTALLSVDLKGQYVSKKLMVGVDADGKKVPIVPSVFDGPVQLRGASVDEYLSMAVKSVYQLFLEEGFEQLKEALQAGQLYYFVYNYRADYEGDDAYLISNGTDIFAVTGMRADLEFIGLEDNEDALADIETEEEDEDLDFAMF